MASSTLALPQATSGFFPQGILEKTIGLAEQTLHTLFGKPQASRLTPRPAGLEDTLSPYPLNAEEQKLAGALMRVNHVGEICAQALYTAQAFCAHNPKLQAHLQQAAQEETDHLAWLEERLKALGAHPSWLNPLWYSGALAIGLLAGSLGEKISLGFVVETERQVEAHLSGHLQRLPLADTASRAVVEQMRQDEAEHARRAQSQGGVNLPLPVKLAMRLAAKVMTTVAHRI